jgi:serine/threonine protein kinase
LIGVLGEGGQGVVYLGQASSGQQVAVKTLHARMTADSTARERFLREAEISRRVAAFCTARFIDAGVAQERPYLVSEYVRGPSLDELIAQEGPRTGGGLDRLAITTLTALAAIHRAGIIHRDFKPRNVIMGQEGPVVIDFGIARMLEQSTTQSGLTGTPAYLSPEQLNGHPAVAASDVFAWAATMVYAATGHPAFPGALAAVVINAIMTREPDLSDTPARLRPLLAACLVKDPAARPDVSELFTAFTHERPVESSAALHRGSTPLTDSLQGALAPDEAVPSSARWSDGHGGHGGRGRRDGRGGHGGSASDEPGGSARMPTSEHSPGSPQVTPLPAIPSARGRFRRLGTVLAATVVVLLIPVAFWLKPAVTDLFTGVARPPATSSARPEPSSTGLPFGALIGKWPKGHQKWVLSMAVAQLNGRPVVVSGAYEGTVLLSDLATGTLVGTPLKGHRGPVWSVAVTELDGRPVAISGGLDGTVRLWDLATGNPVREPLAGHRGSVESVAAGQLDGRPVAVSCGLDGLVRVWDLATGDLVSEPFAGHEKWALSVAVTELDGRPVVVSGGFDGRVLVSDLATGAAVGNPLTGHRGPVESVATGLLNRRPVAVSGGGNGDHTVRIWDLSAGTAIGKPIKGHQSWPLGLAVGQLGDGRPVVVSGGYKDRTVRVWDLAAGVPIGEPFRDHQGLIESVALAQLDGRPVAISGGDDGSIRVWSLGPAYPPPGS